jgi:hypothetical protein
MAHAMGHLMPPLARLTTTAQRRTRHNDPPPEGLRHL